jgi:hypothetical protein
MQTTPVLISSTFDDLVDCRRAVQAAIRQLGVIDISMEYFGARDERPKEGCIRLIHEASDVFLGIYAHRYGKIPTGDKISIVEAEYEAAKSKQIPIFVYMLDPSIPWMPQFIECFRRAAVEIGQIRRRLSERLQRSARRCSKSRDILQVLQWGAASRGVELSNAGGRISKADVRPKRVASARWAVKDLRPLRGASLCSASLTARPRCGWEPSMGSYRFPSFTGKLDPP